MRKQADYEGSLLDGFDPALPDADEKMFLTHREHEGYIEKATAMGEPGIAVGELRSALEDLLVHSLYSCEHTELLILH